jgi:branched-chain amino acid aminotransferase
MKAWLNGEFIGLDQANVNLLSHSFGRGSAIFEVFDIVSTVKGPAFFGLNEHIDRLFTSAELVYMDLPLTKDEIIDACVKTAIENNVSQGGTKLFAYYPGLEFTAYPQNQQVDIAIFCVDFAALNISQEQLAAPVKVGISSFRKYHPATVPVHAKICGNYVNSYLALMEVKKKGYDDVITIDVFGNVAEGATSSAFFVKNGKIRVPKLDNVLNGITRMAVLEVIRDIGIPLEVTDIPSKDLNNLDEAFYTVSLQHIQPIQSIEGRALGDCCPGPVTERIINAMNEIYSGKNKKYERWLKYIE